MRLKTRYRSAINATAYFSRWGRSPVVAIVGFIVTGCAAVGPDYEPPDSSVPDKWEQAVSEEMSSAEPDIMR